MYDPKLAPAHGKGTGPKGDPKEAVERVKQSGRNKKEKKAYAC
jgi:hypothetical protein